MKRERLLELAGISSNMNNPSQETYSEVPSTADSPTGGPGTKGYDELGDNEEMDVLDKIREVAQRGRESPEESQHACEEILSLLDDDNDERNEVPPDEDENYKVDSYR